VAGLARETQKQKQDTEYKQQQKKAFPAWYHIYPFFALKGTLLKIY
jgi:hypothetical protein